MTLIENKVLLLNSDYRVLRFVRWSRALKLVFRDKVEILSEWDKKISSYESTHNMPAIIRLKSRVKYYPTQVKFTKLLVKKRDSYTCQYCGKISNNDKICFLDDMKHSHMINNNVKYIHLRAYKHDIKFQKMCNHFFELS